MDIRKSLEAFGMYTGGVLTPELARSLAMQRKSNVPALEDCGLVGWMSPRMHAQIDSNLENIGWRLTVLETPSKQMLLVVTVQAGCCQMRFLAHLADPQIQEMLKWSARNGYMQLLLGVSGQTTVVHYHPTFLQEDLDPLLALAAESRRLATVDTLVEFAEFAAALIHQKNKLVCFGMATVEEVTVTSIVWHQETDAREERSETIH